MKTRALRKWMDGDVNRGVLLTSTTPTSVKREGEQETTETTFAACAVIVRSNSYTVYDYARSNESDEKAYELLSEKFESEASGIMQSAEK